MFERTILVYLSELFEKISIGIGFHQLSVYSSDVIVGIIEQTIWTQARKFLVK